MARKYTSEQWIGLLSDYQESNMSASDWCKSKGIQKSTLYYWMKKHKDLNTEIKEPTTWVEVSLPSHKPTENYSAIFLKIGDFTLSVEPGFDKTTLQDVLGVVMNCAKCI